MPDLRKRKTSYQEGIDGVRWSLIQRGHRMTSGKLFVSTVTGKGILLATVLRNNDNHANNVSGNHALAPAVIDKPKLSLITNKYMWFAMTAHQNKGPKIGSPTSPMSKTTSKNSSCNRCWEQRDRIFKTLEPDGLGKSYSL